MNGPLRRQILTSVSAGALAGVLGATGMAAFAAGGSETPATVEDDDPCGTAVVVETASTQPGNGRMTWFVVGLNAME